MQNIQGFANVDKLRQHRDECALVSNGCAWAVSEAASLHEREEQINNTFATFGRSRMVEKLDNVRMPEFVVCVDFRVCNLADFV